MSTRIVEAAAVTLPLLDQPLQPATLTGTPAICGMLRDALDAFVRFIREVPAERP